jgi:hypothetical protein
MIIGDLRNATLWAVWLAAAVHMAAADDAPIDFNRDVRPIFNQHCTACHGGVRQAADISFIYRDTVIDAGIAIPGQPDDSELLARVTSDDPEVRMPPPDEGRQPLSAAEIELLRRWILQGAPWGTHWSYARPIEPPAPDVSRPQWVGQSLDAFVVERLDAEQLTPSPPAPPAEWLRRATFDLTGLPPTPEQTARFLLACRQSANHLDEVYAAEVDRLLASPHYGERWAAMWMDLARYADTMGYEKDPHRDMWPYRDWLVQAFNQDMPFDQFTIKQLAGDLLPEPTAADLIATAFHRNTQTNTEGGTDDEEFRVSAVIDRINSTWTIWQATTFGCVQCHSHPYDPFEHSEYYAYMAFFNNTEDHDLDDDFPTVRLPTDPHEARQAVDLDREQRAVREALNQAALPLVDDQQQWISLVPSEVATSHGKLQVGEDHQIRVAGGTFPPGCVYTVSAPVGAITALRVQILPESDNPADWPETGSVLSKLELSLKLPDGEPQEVTIAEVFADFLAGPFDAQAAIRDGADGFGGYPKLLGPRWAVFVLDQPLAPPAGSGLVIQLKQDAQTTGSRAVHMRRFAIDTSLRAEWTQLVHDSQRAEAWRRYRELSELKKGLQGPAVAVMRQRHAAATRETRMFVRGNWLDRGDRVQPAVPAIFPGLEDSHPDRLALARWLVSDRNPLTARALVNRLWAQLFGVGLIETQEDFGSMGTVPSHPALLDHLAIRLQRDHAWHIKPLLKECVLSATYRQTQRTSDELRERDPQNRLLARGPRTRLSAEMIRDQALAASGLLSRATGGPSVMPPQPDGVWRTVYNNAQWINAKGPDRYRRGLYTYWRRTSPYPSFLTFDAPTREFCTARRLPTNTPLQALVTLNDPVYVECADALAQRAFEFAGDVRVAQLRWAYQAVTTEPASSTVLTELGQLYEAAYEQYGEAHDDVAEWSTSAEQYALAVVANTIFNLDAALNK